MPVNKIVLVEDENLMAELIKIELEAEGHEVLLAFDGKAGLEMIKKTLPNLILLDVMMPELDGFEVLKFLKEDPATKEIPVIMLTAKGLEEEIQKGLDLGAHDYVSKPFHAALLIKKIQMTLNS